jgi:hypothetical protein
MNSLLTGLLNRIVSFFQSAWTMKLDFISLAGFTALLMLSGTIAGKFDGGWAIANLMYAVAIAAAAVHLPWLFIALAFPNTLNKFVNQSWDKVFARLNDSTKFKLVLGVYIAFVAVFSIIAWAVFVGVPVGG